MAAQAIGTADAQVLGVDRVVSREYHTTRRGTLRASYVLAQLFTGANVPFTLTAKAAA
jgi:predicted methyltransferase MtxX (methanogen marker protein 4)